MFRPYFDQEDRRKVLHRVPGLRAPVDAFFEGVKVNDDDKSVRENRLELLSRLRATLHLVADFSKIEG